MLKNLKSKKPFNMFERNEPLMKTCRCGCNEKLKHDYNDKKIKKIKKLKQSSLFIIK
jgi:hypothetical protein